MRPLPHWTALFLVAILSITACSSEAKNRRQHTPISNASYAQYPPAMRFATELAQRNHLDAAWVRHTLGQARHLDSVHLLMLPPTKTFSKNWQLYRNRFIDPARITAGVEFWENHRATLARAQELYGVPAEIIVGILGVETIYGRNMGSFRVLDALATLAFDFPAEHPRAHERSEFFKAEIEQFFILHDRADSSPWSSRGSYAGAMGMPQFMPSSWNKYAVDFDDDGKVDLQNSAIDAIGSVGNYLKTFGWQRGMPTHYPVSFDLTRWDKETLLAPDILPTFHVPSLLAKGAVLSGPALEHPGLLALVELLNGDGEPSYVLGTENFYAITRYNHSSYYAMAVIELGRAVVGVVGR